MWYENGSSGGGVLNCLDSELVRFCLPTFLGFLCVCSDQMGNKGAFITITGSDLTPKFTSSTLWCVCVRVRGCVQGARLARSFA